MRLWNLRWLALVPALASALMASSPAAAQTMVLPAPQDSTEVRELRVAFSSFSGRSASWVQLGLDGGADDVFVVVPAPAGARIDMASDAWFEALSATTNPRVLPPQGDPPACTGKPAPAIGTAEIVGSDAHQLTTAPEPGSTVLTLSQLLVWAGNEGLSISGDQAASLADLEVAGHSFVVVRFQPAAGESLTRTIRVAPSSPSSFVPLLLSRAGTARVAVSAWVLSAGRAVPDGLPGKTVEASKLKWSLTANPSSNYGKLRDELLSSAAGQAWVVEAASHSTLFFHTSLPGGTGMVPSLAGAYFERAAGYGDAPDSYATCTGKLATLESSALKVTAACGRGDLASIGSAACTEDVSEYEISPEYVRCGKAADDLAIALSGAVPATAWLTRWTSWIEPFASRPDEAFHAVPLAPSVGPLFSASGWESECSGDAGADSGKGGSGNAGGAGGSNGGWAGSGGVSGYTGQYGGSGQGGYYGGGYGNNTGTPGQGGYGDGYYDDGYYDDGYYDNGGVGVGVEGSCSSSSSSSSSDSCSGNSSSSDSGGDSCSSDSSDSGGDSCSGNSSDGEAESCSGDSSGGEADSCSGDSSSGGGESCSGSSSSGGGPESCSGSSGGSSDCSVARSKGGRRRPPLSGLTLGLVAVMLPLRRFLRSRGRKQAQDSMES